jgi:hypothetical protein
MAIEGLEPEPWTQVAPCSGRTDEWFPSHPNELASGKVREARRACLVECPFRRRCLEECFRPMPKLVVLTGVAGRQPGPDRMTFAERMVDSSRDGVWAGTVPRERGAVRDLPVAQRIEVLLLWTGTAHVGPDAPATREEIRRPA